jgi:hypothetical protein
MNSSALQDSGGAEEVVAKAALHKGCHNSDEYLADPRIGERFCGHLFPDSLEDELFFLDVPNHDLVGKTYISYILSTVYDSFRMIQPTPA